MRKIFAEKLYDKMKVNDDIYLITGDLGYGLWDRVRDDFPNRFFNVGSSEMSMMGMGIGLAMEGKIPFVYSITPFAIYRPFEMIRNYINHEKIPVNIIGGGRNNTLTSTHTSIAGGSDNFIGTSGRYSFIGGGGTNKVLNCFCFFYQRRIWLWLL